MNKVLKLEVSQELVDYIERLSFEEASLKDIITTYLDLHKEDKDDSAINNPIFESYQKKYLAAKTEYELAKKRITAEYIPDCLLDQQYDWNLDFSSNILTINVKGESSVAVLNEYLDSFNKSEDTDKESDEKTEE